MQNFLTTQFKKINILLLMFFIPYLVSCNNEDLFLEAQVENTEDILENTTSGIQDPVFTFNPQRWGIVQGVVSDEVALKNKEILNSIMTKLKEININTMKIGAMDAYFKVDVNKIGRVENAGGSIQIPSDFHLEMSDDTYLRVQPNAAATYTLMTTYLTDNSKISGGNLVGDRFEHDYSPFTDAAGVKRDEHGWGHLIWIIGSHNVIVDNVNLSNATGDGIVFHSETLRNNDGSLMPGTREVNNVIVRNVNIDECRRNGISILDGRNITFDNCNITNTGQGEQQYDASGSKIYSSSGTAPRYGIDLESIRTRNEDGTLNETALIEGVFIKNSNFTGNEAGDIVVYTASNVIIENNYFDKWVANKASHNVTIRNNTFESRDPSFFAIGINSFITSLGEELNHDYVIVNNIIKNYGIGIRVAGLNQLVSNNTILNCTTGIFLINDLVNSTFRDNQITSNLNLSYGYKNFYNCQNLDNVTIKDEIIEVQNRPINFNVLLNNSVSNTEQVTFTNCLFNTANSNFKMLIKATKNIKFESNRSNTDFQIIDSENIVLINNQTNL
ncbi:right-handed parallel beta-helix repeat-containing protein [Hwangdonia lutea]|uniref:Right-handed parallel beta-helix repeat-containing protein n=1 Tax=Hwangdonia lutea TaxID=3075823 RepID=A0AA97EMW3_9FLAO|nr:right-handed parallel beta-helix repeat-containing protein [Hwangdonia sp. SCSIO 19198]WOD43369.1 right-handed parallel beta-helix repeat-containing protein [Hwangdonia sp. SCSIO 19198]